jgi:pimeloyl-ACP methyl ester carboxylesterase
MAFVIGGVVAGYVAVCAIASIGYPRILFPAPRLVRAPKVADPSARLLELPHADGTRTHALHFPAPAGARTVVVLHGNGETMFDGVGHALELKRRGLGVLLVEYRGYGTTHGPPPSEESLYEDGEAAVGFLAREEHLSPERVALWGWSLGSGVAAELARRGHGARLVLLAPFTSITDMARRFAPLLPVALLVRHRLDTLSKAASIEQPTLVVHGDDDELIPLAMGEAVARAMPSAKLVRVAGGHHADLLIPGSGARPDARELLDRLAAHLAE